MASTYTVKAGDTLWDLARKYGTTVNAIAQASGIRNPSQISVGQQITIPTKSVSAPIVPPAVPRPGILPPSIAANGLLNSGIGMSGTATPSPFPFSGTNASAQGQAPSLLDALRARSSSVQQASQDPASYYGQMGLVPTDLVHSEMSSLQPAQPSQLQNALDAKAASLVPSLSASGAGYAGTDPPGTADLTNPADRRVLQTIIAEAGGNPAGMAAVSAVIQNRANASGRSPLQIVSAPYQFEGYSNPGRVVATELNDPNLLQRAQDVYNGIANHSIADPTNGGTMYHADTMTPYWARSVNTNGYTDIGGNRFYLGSGSQPQTALAAIDQVAPNPQQRPSALAYTETPSAVRAFSVNPDGTPASLEDALIQRYGSASIVPRGTSAASLYGNISLPEAMPVQPPIPSLPQQLVSHPVQTVPVNPYTGNPGNTPMSLQDAVNAKAQRIASGEEQFTPTTPSIVPRLNYPSGVMKTTTAQAGNVALPPGVVPHQALLDMNAAVASQINSSGSPSDRDGAFSGTTADLLGFQPAPKNGWIPPTPVTSGANYTTAMTGWNGPLGRNMGTTPLTSIPTLPGAESSIIAGKDQSELGPLPPTAYVPTPLQQPGVAAIDDATNPFAGVTGAVAGSGIQPSAYSPRALPLTAFNTVNQGSQIIPRIQSGFNSTPLGHIFNYFTGNPVQGGLLGMIPGIGGLLSGFAGNGAPAAAPTGVPGTSYLNAAGIPTANLNAPQVANALRDSILGNGGRGSFN